MSFVNLHSERNFLLFAWRLCLDGLRRLVYKLFIQTHEWWKADPKLPWYIVFIKVLWEPLLSFKRSHFCVWIKNSVLLVQEFGDFRSAKPLVVPADTAAWPRINWITDFLMTNWLWQRTVTIRPDAAEKPFESIISYRIIIKRDYDGKIMFNSLILHGSVALLQGPQPFSVWAFDYNDDTPIKLKMYDVGKSRYKLGKVPLL